MGASVGGFLDYAGQIVFFGEIDVCLCAKGFGGFGFCGTAVDGDGSEAHYAGELQGKGTEAASRTKKNDVIALLGIGDFKSFVGCYSTALN